jgi:hypothetical protein
MADNNAIQGDAVGRDKIDTQINHYHAYYGPDKQNEHNRHTLYLRRLFQKPWAYVTLSDIGAGDQPLHLCNVYVPLPVDLQITVRVQKDAVRTWWVGADDMRRADADAPNDETRQRADAHGLNAGQLGLIVDGIQRRLTEEADARYVRQTPEQRANEAKEEPESRNRSYTLTAEDLAALSPALVVLGAPGSGKSSFARHFVLRMAAICCVRLAISRNTPMPR